MKKEIKVVLIYHGFNGKDNYSISTRKFEKQVIFLIKKGFRFVNLENLNRETGRVVCLTFDDGYSSQYDAFRILKKYNLVGTFFVVSSFVNRGGYLNVDQLKEMKKEGMLIGAHTLNHKNLKKVNEKDLDHELEESKKQLEKMLGSKITSFSFPGGKYSKEIINRCFNFGYEYLRTSDIAHVNKEKRVFPAVSIYRGFQNLSWITNKRFIDFVRFAYKPLQFFRKGENH
jgi:peptidoglycan/xylan/chitin deacetylase (PgdA/CDA1 family)